MARPKTAVGVAQDATPEKAPEAAPSVGVADLAAAIREVILETKGPQRVRIGQHKPKTPFNPTGRKRTLEREFSVNGYPLQERYLHDEEIELLHQLKPGRYIDKLVRVVIPEDKEDQVQIWYSDRTVESRFHMKGLAATFGQMLRRMVRESNEKV